VAGVARRRPRETRAAAAALGPPVLGALLALGVTVTIGYIAQRYLADFIPLLVLVSLVGLHHLSARTRDGAPWSRPMAVVLGLAALVGCYVNFSLGLLYERQYGFVPEAVRAELIAWQLNVDAVLPGDQSPRLRSTRAAGSLPRSADEGELVVVGECAGLYQFDGEIWRPVERTNATGRFRFELRLADAAPNARYELVGGGSGDDRRSLVLERRSDERVAFVFRSPGSPAVAGPAHEINPDVPFVFDVVMDRRLNALLVVAEGRPLFGRLYAAPDDRLRVGTDLPGELVDRPLEAPVCQELVKRR